jgi:hypothetical protein
MIKTEAALILCPFLASITFTLKGIKCFPTHKQHFIFNPEWRRQLNMRVTVSTLSGNPSKSKEYWQHQYTLIIMQSCELLHLSQLWKYNPSRALDYQIIRWPWSWPQASTVAACVLHIYCCGKHLSQVLDLAQSCKTFQLQKWPWKWTGTAAGCVLHITLLK